MSATDSKQRGRGFFSFRRRSREWKEISGYHVTDVQELLPVAVTAGTTVVGDIHAPKISVAGTVFGSTVALETIVERDGQIWGDVFTANLQIVPGGKIRGWIGSLDEASYYAWQSGENPPPADPAHDLAVPPEGQELTRTEEKIDLMRQLQAEAAAALAARAELEQTFDKRLNEVAGERAAKVASLYSDLEAVQAESETRRRQIEELEAALQARDAQVERQANELQMARELLTERNQELAELGQAHKRQNQEYSQLQVARSELEAKLQEAQQQNESLAGRLHSLETALQASLQHTAEQEESLVRWQELAEITDRRSQELEQELQLVKGQLQESTRTAEMLRLQRRQLEDEWQRAQDELDSMRDRDFQSPLPLSTTAGDPAELIARLADLEVEAARAADLESQLERLATLEDRLAEMEQAAQEQEAQILWYRLNLKTSRAELEGARAQSAVHQTQLEQQAAQLKQLQAKVREKESEIVRLSQQSAEQEQRLVDLQDQFTAYRQEMEKEKTNWQTEARDSRTRAAAYEAELQHYLQEIEEQGKRLAEMRMALVERELQLKETRETAVKLGNTMKQMRQVTSERIQSLETQLAHSNQRLKDLTAVLERRQRRQE